MLGTMTRFFLLLTLSAGLLSGCSVVNKLRGVPDSNPEPGVTMPADLETGGEATDLAATAGAQTPESLDQTSEAERIAAIAPPVSGSERELGRVIVALGPVTEQGFWLKSSLVTEPSKGRVVTVTGTSVAVDLLPGEGAATLSLAAFRALELSLTELPELAVFTN
jgi:hypothetical protein